MTGTTTITIDGRRIAAVSANTVIVGTGAAGYCAADRLTQFGQQSVIMVTDKVRAGASRNAGSDKQTYYKLTLAGDGADSVRDMAETLFAGGAMDGDIALAEAALSARCFYHLVEAGVSFPSNRSGEFIGYKTDHDPRQRATSVGPYTSKTMVERLEERVLGRGVQVLDACRIIDLVIAEGRCVGLLCLRTDVHADDPTERLLLVRATNVVYATGGPAGMYADSVYPHGQWGANGAPLRAGVTGRNLTEWQFGLASIKPRWNVSGTYMQAIPRFVSTDADGHDEREFLREVITDEGQLGSFTFLKGYQWPFDVRKALDGSSLVDVLVYRETVLRGRRVFLDFRSNGGDGLFHPELLTDEVRTYLERAGVIELDERLEHRSTPIQRLQQMNRPAYEFYLNRNPGIDLETDMLEVAVCAQHNNGGLGVDSWWRSSLPGFFAIGEAAGAHGVYRPGGAALNSGQVGATRAATWISTHCTAEPLAEDDFGTAAAPKVEAALSLITEASARHSEDNTDALLNDAARLMSDKAGMVRSRESVAEALEQVQAWLDSYATTVSVDVASRRSVNRLFLIRDILDSQRVYLAAMLDYLDHGGRSRGAVLYTDPSGQLPGRASGPAADLLEECFRFSLDDGALAGVAQQVTDRDGTLAFDWRDVLPIPSDDDFFENVWKDFRENGNVV